MGQSFSLPPLCPCTLMTVTLQCRTTSTHRGQHFALIKLFLTQPLEPHRAPTAGNYQVKCDGTWIIQWGCCTIKSCSNQPMLPNRHMSVHTWKRKVNNVSRFHPLPSQPSPPQPWSDIVRTTRMGEIKTRRLLLLFTLQGVFIHLTHFGYSVNGMFSSCSAWLNKLCSIFQINIFIGSSQIY